MIPLSSWGIPFPSLQKSNISILITNPFHNHPINTFQSIILFSARSRWLQSIFPITTAIPPTKYTFRRINGLTPSAVHGRFQIAKITPIHPLYRNYKANLDSRPSRRHYRIKRDLWCKDPGNRSLDKNGGLEIRMGSGHIE